MCKDISKLTAVYDAIKCICLPRCVKQGYIISYKRKPFFNDMISIQH